MTQVQALPVQLQHYPGKLPNSTSRKREPCQGQDPRSKYLSWTVNRQDPSYEIFIRCQS